MDTHRDPGRHEREREPRLGPAPPAGPAPAATAAAAVALATGVLAAGALLALGLGLMGPLVARGALVVALGGTILGITLAAVGLMVTRHRRDPIGRRRAWLGAALSLALLAVLLAGFERWVGDPIEVPAAEARAE